MKHYERVAVMKLYEILAVMKHYERVAVMKLYEILVIAVMKHYERVAVMKYFMIVAVIQHYDSFDEMILTCIFDQSEKGVRIFSSWLCHK